MSNDVQIAVDGERFRFWEQTRIELFFDGISTIEFDTPFTPSDPLFREIFRPFSFKPLESIVNDKPLFTGTLVPVAPDLIPERKMISVGGYASPGVLADCTQAASALPLEYRKQTLEEIAQTIADPFSIEIDFQVDPGPAFDKVKMKPTTKILSFLVELAKQRNVTFASTETGALRGHQEISSGVPVALLEEGLGPLIGVTPVLSPQQYYSDITGLKPMKLRSKKSVQYTVKNTLLSGVVRPLVFQVPNVKDADISAAVEAKVGRMFANMVHYNIRVNTWRDPLDELWAPNTLVRVHAPGAMIYEPYTFLIRSVSLFKNATIENSVLNCVLPGSFSGKIPGALPWDG